MSKKQINQSAMDALMGGLASAPSAVPASRPSVDAAPQEKVRKTRICTMCNEHVWNKVQSIARRENIPLNDLVSFGLSLVVKQYEQKHGEVRIDMPSKGSLSDIFE